MSGSVPKRDVDIVMEDDTRVLMICERASRTKILCSERDRLSPLFLSGVGSQWWFQGLGVRSQWWRQGYAWSSFLAGALVPVCLLHL